LSEHRLNPIPSRGGAPVRFADLTRTELQERAARGVTVLVPLGATEQHGPHLPVDTDTFLAESMCIACAEQLDDVLVAPAVPWGLSHGHMPLGATITLQPATYLSLLLDLCESLIASGFADQVWVNGHNSNKSIQAALVYEAQRRWDVSLGAVSYYDFAGPRLRELCTTSDFHAGEMETSLVKALGEDRVRPVPEGTGTLPSRITSYDPLDVGQGGPALVGMRFAERFPDGVAGDPRAASEATGARIAEVALEGLVRFVSEYAEYRRPRRAAE
jgi:creatinine amidohydrolase